MLLLSQIANFNQFDISLVWPIVAVLVMLVVSALVSGSETAFFSLTPTDMNNVKKSGNRSDTLIIKLLESQDYLLGTILIVNNLVNICIVLLSSSVIDRVVTFGSTGWEFLVKTVIVTFMLLLFGEIMPKLYASYRPLGFARQMAAPLIVLKTLFKPFSFLLVKSGDMGRRVPRKGQLSIDELSDAIEITTDQSEQEKQMLSGIVNFVSRDVSEIMKLRMDIVAIDQTADFTQVRRAIIDSGFSRIPVYEENIDTVIGILYVKDMLPFISEQKEFNWQTHLRKPYFVPENKKITDLLEEFQAQKVHIAIVVDEYGATQGLVSLEDIMEEVVGEITDESDVEEPTFYKKINDTTYIFDGKTHLSDFEKVMGLDDTSFDSVNAVAETLAGLLLELKRDFLRKGESVTSAPFIFTVTELDGRRIDKIKVVKKEQE